MPSRREHPRRRSRRPLRGAIAAAAMTAVTAASPGATPGADPEASQDPFVPARADEVLERLNGDPSRRLVLRARRQRLAADPRNLDLAVDTAWRLIEAARATGDPRYAGYAEAALRPWWDEPSPPTPVLLLRATIAQSRHHFAPAIEDLRALLRRDPGNARGWLTLAVVETVVGEPGAAAHSCRPLHHLTDALAAAACQAHVAGLSGNAEAAFDSLERALADGVANTALRAWAHGVLAEIAVRLGRFAPAESHFQTALSLTPEDRYLRYAWADMYLDLGRPGEAIAALGNDSSSDGALLRRTIAARTVGRASDALTERLSRRFESLDRRGDSVHLAEAARLSLVLGDARRALRLAARNWTLQREPRDARVLLEAALETGDGAAAKPVLEWMARTGVQDLRLADLAARLVP